MKRMLAVIISIACLLCGCAETATPVEEFSYELADGEVTITGYTGISREIVIPTEIAERPVTKIRSYAFSGYDMTSIELPNTLTEIGYGAFSGCKCLTEVTVPDNVTIIQGAAFYGCTALVKVKLPNGLKTIQDGAFNSCIALEEINIPDGLEYLGKYSLAYCDSLMKDEYRVAEKTCTYQSVWSNYTEVTTYTYGNKQDVAETVKTFPDGQEAHSSVTTEYDDEGKIVRVISYFEGSSISNGVVQIMPGSEQIMTYEYNADGKLSSAAVVGEDGTEVTVRIWEYYEDTYKATQFAGDENIEYFYNNRGDLVTVRAWRDEDMLYRIDYEYGEFGLEYISHTSGPNSSYTEYYCKVQCDAYGNVTEEVRYYGNYYDYGLDVWSTTLNTYDEYGNLVSSITESEDERIITEYQYQKVD